METVIVLITDLSRFFFIIVVAYILYRLADNALAEYAFRKEALAGQSGRYFGYLTIVRVPENAEEGLLGFRYGLKWENSIGSGRQCDIPIVCPGVAKRQAVLYLRRDAAVIHPLAKGGVRLNGVIARKGDEAFDGDILSFGGISTRIRLEMEEDA